MKKILFGSAAAICAVAGFSSFKSSKVVTSYYFKLNSATGITPGIGSLIAPNQVTYAGTSLPAACTTGATSYDCVVTFTQHLNANKTKITVTQAAKSTVRTRAAQ